ncbi:MAG: hypothetical protein HY894_05735 [Deltaproteobacteria bacterium]|nr:hypothetical protein [Deltaproteobacteria bacterium]
MTKIFGFLQGLLQHNNQATIEMSSPYKRAKELSICLFDFPYKDPATVPSSIRQDKPLMDIIVSSFRTTIGIDGRTQQSTLESGERKRLQGEFKTRIYQLLDNCLFEEPEYGPALLLYPKVAEWNSRAADRAALIALYERLLPFIEQIRKGTKGYDLIERDIEGMYGNCFDKVERHLADFYYELGGLYIKTGRVLDAVAQYNVAENLMPPIYAGAVGMAYGEVGDYKRALKHIESALKLPMEKLRKDLLKQYYSNVAAEMEEVVQDAEV